MTRLTVAALACVWLASMSFALDLVVEGQPRATIVIPDEPLPVVQAAAAELQYHVHKASGATLPIAAESANTATARVVFLGVCKATLSLGLNPADLAPNGFFVRSAAGNLHLLGDDSDGQVFWIQQNNRVRVGTLFAVYELLQNRLGVRWLWPGPLGEVVPTRNTIRLDAPDQTFTPPFVHSRWRDGGRYMAGDHGWVDQKNRSAYISAQSKWLRRHRFAMGINMNMAHSFTDWWKRFATDHPEFFNLLPDGTRRSDPTYHGAAPKLIAMCVHEPGLWRQKIADWAARRSPQAPYVDASENDTSGKCTCPLCLAMDEPGPAADVPFDQRVTAARKAFAAGEKDWWKALGSLSDRYARYFLALQREAQKIEPDAVVMGYAYANYAKPPVATTLNDRIIVGIVPALMFPWTSAKRAAFIEQWTGWSATGARLLLRPNYMLDGHCFPICFARALGEDFHFAIEHGLIGTDFDSLTGQWSAQGPNLYVLARKHAAPGIDAQQCLDEYCAAFGPAAAAVRAYFGHWEKVSANVTQEAYRAADLHWSRVYRHADTIFTPEVMRTGRQRIERAAAAAQEDATAAARVSFLEKGLRNAELTLATQAAFRTYRDTGNIEAFTAALDELDRFRADIEDQFVANVAYLSWSESVTWDRGLIRMMARPGERLHGPWKFSWDPEKIGETQAWYAEGFDDTAWPPIQTSSAWEEQQVGRQWRAEHQQDYDGIAWYRTRFALPDTAAAGARVRLIFGAVDEACKIWVNGQPVLERPYPFAGDPDSWRKAFEQDVTAQVHRDRPNTLAVRVEDTVGAGGIWKPVWVTVADPLADGADNLVHDGGFETRQTPWKKHVQAGRFRFALDRQAAHSGSRSAMLQCTETAAPDIRERLHTPAWARWYQVPDQGQKGKTYRLRLWYRTDTDFSGNVRIWVTGTSQGTMQAQGLNTGGVWRRLVIDDIRPGTGRFGIYLNLMDGTGAAWFDDVELTEAGD